MEPGASDAELVAEVLGGRVEGFRTLVERHEDRLFRHALSLGVAPDVAADMVQDSLVRAWEKLAECRNPARFGLWVGRILRNRCLDHLKSAPSRYATALGAVADGMLHKEGVADGGPQVHVERLAIQAALNEALSRLPVEQSEAFVLKHVEGYGYPEMVELTGASVSALKMRVHRARDAIREHLEAKGLGPG